MMRPAKSQSRWVIASAAMIGAIALDAGTKWLLLNVVMMPPQAIEIAPFFNLTLSFNRGVSFGMFHELFLDHPILLAGITAAMAAGLSVWAMRVGKRIETVALGLIAGAAAGNVVDRIRQGAVTDFLDFHVGSWHWPAFNMADVMIFIGVTLLITGSFWPARSVASLPVQPSRASDATAGRGGGPIGERPMVEGIMPHEKPRRRRT